MFVVDQSAMRPRTLFEPASGKSANTMADSNSSAFCHRSANIYIYMSKYIKIVVHLWMSVVDGAVSTHAILHA